MEKMNSACTASSNVSVYELDVQKMEDRKRHQRHVEDDVGSIDQVVQALQEILPQLPLLALHPVATVAASGNRIVVGQGRYIVMQSAGFASLREQAIQDGKKTILPMSQALNHPNKPAGSATTPVARFSKEMRECKAGQPSTSLRVAISRQIAATSIVPPVFPTLSEKVTSLTEAGMVDHKHRKEGDDEVQQPVALQTTGPSRRDLSDSAIDRAVPMLRTSLSESNSEEGWVYSFRSWGAQHAVRIVPTICLGQKLASSVPLTLHPTSALVEQRLSVHREALGVGGYWLLHDQGESEQQGQDSRRQQQKEESDS